VNWSPVLQGPYGDDLRQCKSVWPTIVQDGKKVEECMEKLVFAVAPRMADPAGIEPIGTEGFEPIFFKHLVLANTALLQGNLTDLKIYNGTEYLKPGYVDITYDPAKKLAVMEARGDTATAVGDYSLKLNFNALLSAGTPAGVDEGTVSTGTVVLKAFEPRQTIKLYMRETKNKKGLTVEKTESSAGFGKVEVKFTPSRSDDPLGNLLNILISGDAVQQLVGEFMGPANKKTAQGIGSLFHRGWWKLDKL
jgi:hypothetical protein